MKYYIGADIGTSALKLMLIDEGDNIVRTASREYPLSFPKPSWSEQQPSDWWTAFVDGVKELVSGIDGDKVAGIGLGGQMHGLVLLDENDQVLRPAILWNDGRTEAQTKYLREIIGEQKLVEYTANIAFAGFTAPKILWVQQNEPEIFAKVSKMMLPKDYVNYRLTGVCATDYSDASGMLLLDVKNKRWSKEMLEICSIREEQLPTLYESGAVIGTLNKESAALLGLSETVKVVAGAGDNAASAVGVGAVREGMCNISLGTSGTIFIPTEQFKALQNPAIHNFCHASGGYHLMGCILSAASCNKWFCENILKTDAFADEQTHIDEAKLGENTVMFLPYLMGERSPINDTDASGTFIGLRAGSKREDMLLAVLEGVAFALRDNFELVRAAGVDVKESLLTGGGAKSPLWQKIIANVLNIPLLLPAAQEGPSMGGALLAKAACSGEKIRENFEIVGRVEPQAEIAAKYEQKYQQWRTVYPALKEVYKNLK